MIRVIIEIRQIEDAVRFDVKRQFNTIDSTKSEDELSKTLIEVVKAFSEEILKK